MRPRKIVCKVRGGRVDINKKKGTAMGIRNIRTRAKPSRVKRRKKKRFSVKTANPWLGKSATRRNPPGV